MSSPAVQGFARTPSGIFPQTAKEAVRVRMGQALPPSSIPR